MIRLYTCGLIALLWISPCWAQSAGEISGTYSTPDYSLALRLREQDEDRLEGTLQSTQGIFALQLIREGNGVRGKVYTGTASYPFRGTVNPSSLTLTSETGTYTFYLVRKEHGLDGVDLSSYFTEAEASGRSQAEVKPAAAKGSKGEVFECVAGSQLVFYQRTSYVNDNTASSITYVNFCRDGRFSLNYDGGFSVVASGGGAQGANYGSRSGTWRVDIQEGVTYVTLIYGNGQRQSNPVQVPYLRQGRWRVGNTQYALVRNKVRCP